MTLYNALSCFLTKESYNKLSEKLIGTQNNTKTPEAIFSHLDHLRTWTPVAESEIDSFSSVFTDGHCAETISQVILFEK